RRGILCRFCGRRCGRRLQARENAGADALSPRVDKRVRVGGAAVPQDLWQNSLSRLKKRVSATELGCWVEAIHPVAVRERRLYGEVPSAMHLEQIRSRLQPEISGVLEELLGPGAELVLCVNKDRQSVCTPAPRPARAQTGAY